MEKETWVKVDDPTHRPIWFRLSQVEAFGWFTDSGYYAVRLKSGLQLRVSEEVVDELKSGLFQE